jgi:hypothetical protein
MRSFSRLALNWDFSVPDRNDPAFFVVIRHKN